MINVFKHKELKVYLKCKCSCECCYNWKKMFSEIRRVHHREGVGTEADPLAACCRTPCKQ